MSRQAWQLIYKLHDQGLTPFQIAERVGVSDKTVRYHLKTRGQPKKRTRSNAGTGRPPGACVDCGIPIHPGADRCRPCTADKASRRAMDRWRERVDMLVNWASVHGVVPTARQAMEILDLGRSQSARLVLDAFGRDERDGYHRRSKPRPYPARVD